jgi:hypothetical protein
MGFTHVLVAFLVGRNVTAARGTQAVLRYRSGAVAGEIELSFAWAGKEPYLISPRESMGRTHATAARDVNLDQIL